MRNHRSKKDIVHKRAVKSSRSLLLQRLSVYVGLCLGGAVLAGGMLILMFGGTILNSYGKGKLERAFAEAYPGYALRFGKLDYTMAANRLVAQSVTLRATNLALKVGRISLTGIRWARLLWGTAALSDVLAKAGLDATNFDMEFPRAHYGIRCARLRASMPGSELIAEETELRPLIEDEELFAADAFRTTRFRVVVPECRVSGLGYNELIEGKSYRARSVHFSHPSFDVLVNRDKPVEPFVKSPLMVHEALAAIRQPLQVDSLNITNGNLRYCERVVAGADPGVLTLAAVNVSVESITNHGEASAAILVRAQGNLMDAGVIKAQITIPVTSAEFSLHYSGSLSAMDLTRLDAFLDIAEHIRIKSGSVQEVTFNIDVTADQARGRVRAIYKDLKIAVLDKQTGTEKGLDNRFASFLANAFKFRDSNARNASGVMREGEVNYKRRPNDTFLQFMWFALRSGALDVISH